MSNTQVHGTRGQARGWVRVLSALVPILIAMPAGAQTVVGHVREEGTAQPLVGAFVFFQAEDGTRHNGVLTDLDGRFLLRGRPGRYRLVAELIGYAGGRTEVVELAQGVTLQRNITVPVQAVTLEGITVESGSRCRRRPGSGPATARLWEEASKALEVAAWGQRQGVLRFQVVQHHRELDAQTLQVLKQTESGRSGYFDRSPYRSVPAARLAERGYVEVDEDGLYTYWAPDAEVLLSESFLDTHCFAVAEAPAGEPELIGLRFEPLPEGRLPDIQGVLWIEKGTAELRRLEFTYARLPFRHGRWDQVGGRVDFERLATGAWIVRRWHVRMPLAMRQTGGFGGSQSELTLVSLVEQGAEVRVVSTREGQVLAGASGATVYGTARLGDAPLRDALVEVVGTARVTRTNADGGFRLPGLPAGAYGIRLTHPELSMAGLHEEVVSVDLASGQARRVELDVSLDASRAAQVCAAELDVRNPVLVYGRVLSPGGGPPVADAVVLVGTGDRQRRVSTDRLGTFRACVPADSVPARLVATGSADVPGLLDRMNPAVVERRAAGFVRVDLELPEPAVQAGDAARAGRRSWTNGLLGRVVEGDGQTPVVGAMVLLTDSAGAVVRSRPVRGQARAARGRERPALSRRAGGLGPGSAADTRN
jgi:hypothetical protein